MSKLVLYDISPAKYSGLNELIKFLPQNIRNTYYQYRLCCHQLNLELPLELWCEIIYLFCGLRSNPVPDNKILEWYDQYIRDKRQHELNPVLMSVTNSGNAVSIAYLCADDIDISYDLISIRLEGPNGFYHATIPRLGDLMVGIVQDDRIKSIKFTMNGTPVKYQVNELYEYTIGKAYSHTIEQVSDTNISTTTAFHPDIKLLQDSKYLNEQNIRFWSADIMPFSLINGSWTDIFMELETNEPMSDIKLLYANMGPYLRKSVVSIPITYKNLQYINGMIMVN